MTVFTDSPFWGQSNELQRGEQRQWLQGMILVTFWYLWISSIILQSLLQAERSVSYCILRLGLWNCLMKKYNLMQNVKNWTGFIQLIHSCHSLYSRWYRDPSNKPLSLVFSSFRKGNLKCTNDFTFGFWFSKSIFVFQFYLNLKRSSYIYFINSHLDWI